MNRGDFIRPAGASCAFIGVNDLGDSWEVQIKVIGGKFDGQTMAVYVAKNGIPSGTNLELVRQTVAMSLREGLSPTCLVGMDSGV